MWSSTSMTSVFWAPPMPMWWSFSSLSPLARVSPWCCVEVTISLMTLKSPLLVPPCPFGPSGSPVAAQWKEQLWKLHGVHVFDWTLSTRARWGPYPASPSWRHTPGRLSASIPDHTGTPTRWQRLHGVLLRRNRRRSSGPWTSESHYNQRHRGFRVHHCWQSHRAKSQTGALMSSLNKRFNIGGLKLKWNSMHI